MDNFEQIYRKYAGAIKKYVMSLGADYNLSDDITSETFYKALKNINTYDEKQNMLTWLCTIAKRTYFDHCKKSDNKNLSISDNEELITGSINSPEIDIEEMEQKKVLYQNILNLNEPYKDVIYLRIFADLSFTEIGDIFAKNENWARVTFYRGKIKLKELIDNEM